MKFPANISWSELTSGNFASSTLLEHSYKEYSVFGESGKWGKYSANEFVLPLDIYGLKPEYRAIFQETFQITDEDWEEEEELLPPGYKQHYNGPPRSKLKRPSILIKPLDRLRETGS